MAEFAKILVLIWYMFLPFLPARAGSQFHNNFEYCTNNSKVDTRIKLEGNIIFPLTTLNYTYEQCRALIIATLDSKTELTLMNLRRKQPFERCYGGSVEIFAFVPTNYKSYQFCKSVGNVERINLTSSIRMIYKALFRNDIGDNNTENTVISVHYKRFESTKACRHVLTAQSGKFETSGYPNDPQQRECEWVINTGKGEGISLDFEILNLHYLNCENNFIEVRQGVSIEAPILKKICDRTHYSRSIKSSSTKLWIRVKSSMTNGIRFSATYNTETCEVIIANKQFNFQLPSRTSCQKWNLTAPSGYIAALSFSDMNLLSTDGTSCKGNVLEVWDGETKTSYCNLKRPPLMIMSKGRKLVVTYRSKDFRNNFRNNFKASFTSILPSSYKTNCFVQDRELSFKCNTQQVIPCAWQCDDAMQCSDNSDENLCSDMKERWHKLQVFVIVIGSICASTVIFCIGLMCFRKFIINPGSASSTRRSRNLSITDQSPLTPNDDLPSPPPCYFSEQDDEQPTSVIRGTYFFGDEFSQSGIHSASLFGIPPPRYRSTESLHQSSTETRSIWQRGMSSIPLVPTDSSSEIISLPEEDPPNYESLSADKDEQIVIASQNSEVSIENATCSTENPESSSSDCIANDSGLTTAMPAMELQTRLPETTSFTSEAVSVDNCNSDIGLTNAGVAISV